MGQRHHDDTVFGLDAVWMMVPLPELQSHKLKIFQGRKGWLLICMC